MESILKRLTIIKENSFISIAFKDEHMYKYYHGGPIWKEYKNKILFEHPRDEKWVSPYDLLGYFNGLLLEYPNAKVVSCKLDCLSLEKGYGKSYGFFEDQFLDGPWDLKDFIIAFSKLINHCKDEIFVLDYVKCMIFVNKPKNKKRKRTNIPRGLRLEVFKRDNFRCVYCGASKENGAILHVDHIVPINKGGTDELDNLQTLCKDCNLNKSDVYQRL